MGWFSEGDLRGELAGEARSRGGAVLPGFCPGTGTSSWVLHPLRGAPRGGGGWCFCVFFCGFVFGCFVIVFFVFVCLLFF